LDEAELTRLYQQYGYFVHQRCLQILREPADADDACQEVFIRVQRYGQGRRDGSMLSWLYTIALRVSLDLARRRGREEPTEHLEDERQQGADPDQRATLGAALRKLDATTCEIGVLHYLDGYTQEEVAVRTGYSRRTVGTKLKAFGAHLQQLGFGRVPSCD
jgi:RNA polymerase sigma factor (sigma-70 family)